MLWCLTGIALLTLYATASNAYIYELAQNIAPTEASLIMGETTVQTQLLTLNPNTNTTENDNIKSRTVVDDTLEKVTRKENNKISGPDDEADYGTLLDKAPEDEYLDIDGDATPSNFLKQREVERRAKVPPIVTTPNSETNAIYITVPIYINTSGGMPLTLTVGGQNVPLSDIKPQLTKVESPKEVEPPAKTSQFNRLPHYNEASGRKPGIPMRATNRHRSNMRGRNLPRRHMKRPEKFRKRGSYSFYF